MALFRRNSGPIRDTADRDYVLTATPVVARDNFVVVVGVKARITAERDRPYASRFDPADERAFHAIVVLALRTFAQELDADQLLVSRGEIAKKVEEFVARAPICPGTNTQVTDVEVRRHGDVDIVDRHEFRIVEQGAP